MANPPDSAASGDPPPDQSSSQAPEAPGGDGKARKKKKPPPEGIKIPPAKPKLTKAERRALQEAQRAAKAAKQGGQKQQQQQNKSNNNNNEQKNKKQPAAATPSKNTADSSSSGDPSADGPQQQHPTPIVAHLPLPSSSLPSKLSSGVEVSDLHPAVLKLGRQYAAGEIRGANARCLAMLDTLSVVFRDYQQPPPPPSSKTVILATDIVQHVLKPSFQYLTACRPHSVTMGNAFAFLKAAVAATLNKPEDVWDENSKAFLLDTLQQYRKERVEFADRAISELAIGKLLPSPEAPSKTASSTSWAHNNGHEVILVYGHSQVVTLTLLEYAKQNKNFRVIVADSRPLLEGRQTLQALRQANVDCTYIFLNALAYVLQDVTKAILGAAALCCDGSVLGRVGTATVALQAHAAHLPVLVCSESYKISNRVQLDSLTHNELLLESDDDGSSSSSTTSLNLLYDLTPASFVSGIVTELGIVPPSSVAVLLREMNQTAAG